MIIMLTGKAGCGKDTAFKIIKKYANRLVKHYAFADSLKDIAYKVGWDGIKDEKGRKLLVSLGKAINQYQKNFFVFETANAITEDKDISIKVITDLRLPCEYKAMREWFPPCEQIVLIKIFGRASEYGRTTDDVTERDITEDDIGRCFDFIVDNSVSYDEFENNIKYIVRELGL